MHPYPHLYRVSASAAHGGYVSVTSPALPTIQTAPPPQFDGPGGMWSPETLLCAAVADCFILTFRGVSRAARFEWLKLDCRVQGTLERLESVSQFSRYTLEVELHVPHGSDVVKARSLLERAEKTCLISNSLRGERILTANVTSIAAHPSQVIPS
jgi:organic hydroperoxide reductase OsmC/OhrA